MSFLSRSLLLLCALAAPALAGQLTPLTNQLAGHPSPYLAIHGGDPVHWQQWGPEVLARARAEGKLVFLSSGYYSCHWCHVMHRESFKDPGIAAFINRHFIPVKIDRELRPALDARLIDFVERTRGQAGWPLNVFLTPAGYPLFGMTYLPPEQFRTLLERLAARWQKEGGELARLARQAYEGRVSGAAADDAQWPDPQVLDLRLREQAIGMADEMAGGFGEQTKFPMAPQLLALLDLQQRRPDPVLAGFLRLTLDAMADGGLRDHLGGGFFRYTVDPNWEVPHFEKMLYDNALLARVYLQAADVLRVPRYAGIARDTLDFVLREMQADGGGYVAAFSAVDASGEEGAYYLWRVDEIRRLLTPAEWRLTRLWWGLDRPPAHEGGHHLVPAMDLEALGARLGVDAGAARSRLAGIREKLRAARARRTLPVDDKVLAGWNGLLLTALAEAAVRLDPGYREAGAGLARLLATELWAGDSLLRARRDGRPVGQAALEDYAHVAEGLWAWSQVAGGGEAERHRRLAARLVESAWQRFHGEDGWRLAESLLIPIETGEPAIADSALPAPPAVVMQVGRAMRLDAKRRRGALLAAAPVVERNPFWYASYVKLYGGRV